jgi:ADP-ribose pyrophosphatase YjhB (NUDIX family)
MEELDFDLAVVAQAHDYCHRCGGELGTREFQGRDRDYCPDCNVAFTRKPVPGVHVVVHGDGEVLLLDEPIPQHEGLWSLPGGFTEYDEGPKETGLRELAEETGLTADPDDLTYATTLHVEFDHVALYLMTYGLDRADTSGTLTPEFEDGEAAFHPIEEVRAAAGDRIRESDLERIEQALDA